MSDQNPFEDFDFGEETPSEPQPQEEKPSNRNFMIAIGIIGGIFVLALILLAVMVLFVLPQRNAALREQQQALLAANTATAFAATENAQQALLLLTPSATPVPSPTPVPPTNTPVIVQPPTATPTLTPTSVSDAQKATLAAQQTQLAEGKFTATVLPTSTALPTTGFADEVGLPGMIGIGVALVVIILVARRLRTS